MEDQEQDEEDQEQDEEDKGKGLMESEDLPKKLTALVIDDNPKVRWAHKKLLEKVGVRTFAVETVKQGLGIWYSGQPFDLILMGRDMPGKNGIEGTKIFRKMGSISMIVGVSSSCSTEAEIQEFMAAGLDGHHVKPLTIEIVRDLVQFIIENNAKKPPV